MGEGDAEVANVDANVDADVDDDTDDDDADVNVEEGVENEREARVNWVFQRLKKSAKCRQMSSSTAISAGSSVVDSPLATPLVSGSAQWVETV